MQCPRCGLQNQPGVSACARCGLPVQAPAGGGQYAPPPGGGGPRPPYAPSEQAGQPGGASGWPQPAGQPGPPPGWPQGGNPGAAYPTGGAPPPQAPQPPGGQASGASAPGPTPDPYLPPRPYGGRPPYAGPPATGAPGWSGSSPATVSSSPGRAGRLAATVALALGALLALVYAIWAFTARRGIFSDFASGSTVGVGQAKSNDRTDTILLIVAGVVALVALALWLMRKFGGETQGGLLDNLGLALAGLGALVAIIGLFLASRVSGGSNQAASGDRGVTASLVTGSGFALLALGLVMGLLAVLGGRQRASTSGAAGPGAYPGW